MLINTAEGYQDQAIKVRGNTIFDDATLAGFIECRRTLQSEPV